MSLIIHQRIHPSQCHRQGLRVQAFLLSPIRPSPCLLTSLCVCLASKPWQLISSYTFSRCVFISERPFTLSPSYSRCSFHLNKRNSPLNSVLRISAFDKKFDDIARSKSPKHAFFLRRHIGPPSWEEPRLKYSQNSKGNDNRADVVESQDGVTRTSVYQLHAKQSGDKHIVHSTDLILPVSHIRDVVVSDKVIGQQQRDLSQTPPRTASTHLTRHVRGVW